MPGFTYLNNIVWFPYLNLVSHFLFGRMILFNSDVYMSGAGVEHVGGDMFVSVPKGDAIFMKVSYYLKLFIILPVRFHDFTLFY